MKVLELFGGIGACTQALKRLGIEVEIADYVEIDKYAVASYNAINGTNFEPQDITKWDKDIDVDLIMHGSPCQDISLAGQQAGADEGSGTRSSLMYETIRIVKKLKPKYVIWENVKNLISKKHKHNFDNYIQTLEQLGYKSYWQVLNAKDYGIPQNRERVFTISIRDDIDKEFTFPPKQELKLRLKDMLEDNVDEKYYLSDKQIERIQTTNYNVGKKRIQEKDYCDTLCARDWKDPKCVGVADFRYDEGIRPRKELVTPCLTTKEGSKSLSGNVYILQNPTNTGKINVLGNYSPSKHNASRIVNSEGLAPTVKENHGTVTAIVENKLPGAYGRNFGSKGKVQDTNSYCDTLLTAMGEGGGNIPLCNDLRIRKLTPKECWRLMGFSDEAFEKASKVNSNTQLYKQAGNSIVVNVLEEIFKNLLGDKK